MFEMFVGETEVLFPIVIGDIVFAGADMVADGPGDRVIESGHISRAEAVGAEETVNWFGVFGGEKLAAGIGPEILFGTGDIDRARRHEGNQHVLVDGAIVLPGVIFFEVRAKPMREGCIDTLDCLAEGAPAQGSSAAP